MQLFTNIFENKKTYLFYRTNFFFFFAKTRIFSIIKYYGSFLDATIHFAANVGGVMFFSRDFFLPRIEFLPMQNLRPLPVRKIEFLRWNLLALYVCSRLLLAFPFVTFQTSYLFRSICFCICEADNSIIFTLWRQDIAYVPMEYKQFEIWMADFFNWYGTIWTILSSLSSIHPGSVQIGTARVTGNRDSDVIIKEDDFPIEESIAQFITVIQCTTPK